MKWWIILIFILLIGMASAQTQQYHLKLLAVQETEDGGYRGSDADLFLELKEGSGRVFLDTFPLTKLDTQISTRFAKEIACKHFKLDCEKYDFIYTIKAQSNIIGGPSAGAAISALTTIAVLDLEYDEDVTITGTINSGGIIGPVGGVKEKIDAAAAGGLNKVMIAKGSSQYHPPEEINETNSTDTINLISYGKEEHGINIVEVLDLDEVLFELTSLEFNDKEYVIQEDEEYTLIMKELQQNLCVRTENIEEELFEENIKLTNETKEIVETRKESSLNASLQEDYYSAASFCFSNNIQLKNSYYQEKNFSRTELENLFNILERRVFKAKESLQKYSIETISDLQTYMIVQERLNDAQQNIDRFRESNLSGEEGSSTLSYTEERLYSAISWVDFFDMNGRKYVLDEIRLKNSCIQKISESEERYQYASLFVGEDRVSSIRTKIDTAKAAHESDDHTLCLITASQAKGDANAILSSLGLDENNIDEFVASKIKAVERIIAENSKEGTFPILGYSYYQYANSLKESEKFTSLVYLEYALEMSELGIYFPEEEKIFTKAINNFSVPKEIIFLIEGFAIGLITAFLILTIKKKKKKVKRKYIKKR